MDAALLSDKQTSDLTLHARGDHHRTWVCESLHPRRRVGSIAENLARRIDNYRAGFNADAGVERRLARVCILSVNLSERPLDRRAARTARSASFS
jgi:hypothetical protein